MNYRRGVDCSGENQTCFFILVALWRGISEVGAEVNEVGVNGDRVNGAGANVGLPR